MPKYIEEIPLEKEHIMSIVSGITQGRLLFRDYMREENFPTDNGSQMSIWNYMNRAIRDKLPTERFQTVIMQRGIWKFLGIYDKDTRYLYTLMRKENLKILRQNPISKKYHYLNVLSKINDGLSQKYDVVEEQMAMFPNLMYDDNGMETLKRILSSLTENVDGEIKRYVLITFSTFRDQVVELKGIVTALGLDYYKEENWNSISIPSYSVLDDEWTDSDLENSAILLHRKPNLKRVKKKTTKEVK